jgi:flagellar export protein FliJ
VKPRNKRIALLTERRQRDLNDRVAELHERRQAQARAEQNAARLHSECERARTERTETATRGVSSTDWEQLNRWLESLQRAHLQACTDVQEATAASATAQQNVLAARAALKQIETLSERLRAREQVEERRREQRAADEHAQSASARR